MSCWSWDASGGDEADVLIAEGQRWWTRPSISTCRGRIDVKGLAAHEFGHIFGLLHVDGAAHPDQTMSTYLNGYCSKVERTLGTGDLAGLAPLRGLRARLCARILRRGGRRDRPVAVPSTRQFLLRNGDDRP